MAIISNQRGSVIPWVAFAIALLLVGSVFVYFHTSSRPAPPSPSPTPSPTSFPSPAAGTSGIKGYAAVGPTSPVCRAGESCTSPYLHSYPVTVTPISGRQYASVNANSDGTFQISLPPGKYELSSKGQLYTLNQAVTVTAGQYTSVVIQFDSGIR